MLIVRTRLLKMMQFEFFNSKFPYLSIKTTIYEACLKRVFYSYLIYDVVFKLFYRGIAVSIVKDTWCVKNYSKFETTVFTLAESREFAYNLQEFYKKKKFTWWQTTKSTKTDSQYKNKNGKRFTLRWSDRMCLKWQEWRWDKVPANTSTAFILLVWILQKNKDILDRCKMFNKQYCRHIVCRKRH